MKMIIAISSLMIFFGSVSAKSIVNPANKPAAAVNKENTASTLILDSLQKSSEKTPFKNFNYLDERVKQKVIDMQTNACDQKD